ncbi:MAG: hypothetical protein ACK5H1_06810 [Tenacibaculum sp.]
MTKFKNHFVINLLIILLFNSCMIDNEAIDYGSGPIVVQFKDKTATGSFIQTADSAKYTYDIPIVALGGNGKALNRDIDFTIAADTLSTAREGFEFAFSLGKAFVIKAGNTSANAKIEVLLKNLDASNPKILILQIVSSSEMVSDNNKTEITLQAI